jgi:hypothetical protein
MCSANTHVRFTPNSDRKSGFPHKTMSALPPKADMCGALGHVRFGPIADIVLNRTPQERSLTDRAQARLLCVMAVTKRCNASRKRDPLHSQT